MNSSEENRALTRPARTGLSIATAMLGLVALLTGLAWIAFSLAGPAVSAEPVEAFTLTQPLPAATTTTTTLQDSTDPAPIVETRSAFLDDVAGDGGPVPVLLEIPSLGVSAPIGEVGYEPDTDEMEVPRSASTVGWYRYGPAPGEPGSSVLAAHVDWNGRRGVFFELSQIEPGAEIRVTFDDGSNMRFYAAELDQFAKADLPSAQLFDRTGPVRLTLITCGGLFDEGSYEDNVIVVAYQGEPPSSAA